jgi:hypothetical protein
MADLVLQYADFPLGTADASVIAVAERLGSIRVATIDHRHFRAVRPARCPRFRATARALRPNVGQRLASPAILSPLCGL